MISWRRKILEAGIWLTARVRAPSAPQPENPGSIFLIQPSHIGDVLVDTPLFQALRELYPQAKLVLGCGSWNFATLKGNPHLSELVALDMPWNNVFVNDRRLTTAFRYIRRSQQIKDLAARPRFDLGVDLIGTQLDAMVLMRLGIPFRIGIKGPGGGYSALHRTVDYNRYEPMGRTALRLAELLGAKRLPSIYPQLFLSDEERQAGEQLWQREGQSSIRRKRIIIGPAASLEHKRWPIENFQELARMLICRGDVDIVTIGGTDAAEACAAIASVSPEIGNLAVKVPLRPVFGLIAASDLVICNTNMNIHVAAAFRRPCICVLSAAHESAAQHKTQWGYDITTMLGPDPDHLGIFSAAETFNVAQGLLEQAGT
jgi:ADP-heptose:LPS heptosyltransferase